MRRGFKTLSEQFAAEVRRELGVHGHAPFDPFAYAKILKIPCEPFGALAQDGCSEETLAHLAGVGRQDFSAGTFYLGNRRLILFNEHNSPYSITCGIWLPARATLPTPAPGGYAATNPALSTPSIACRRS